MQLGVLNSHLSVFTFPEALKIYSCALLFSVITTVVVIMIPVLTIVNLLYVVAVPVVTIFQYLPYCHLSSQKVVRLLSYY